MGKIKDWWYNRFGIKKADPYGLKNPPMIIKNLRINETTYKLPFEFEVEEDTDGADVTGQ